MPKVLAKADVKVQLNSTGRPALKKQIARRAKKNGRTASQEILFLILEGLKAVKDPAKG